VGQGSCLRAFEAWYYARAVPRPVQSANFHHPEADAYASARGATAETGTRLRDRAQSIMLTSAAQSLLMKPPMFYAAVQEPHADVSALRYGEARMSEAHARAICVAVQCLSPPAPRHCRCLRGDV